VEDLKIHQVELESQAEELRRTQQEARESRDKYLDQYDHAPVGYVTLAKDGLIVEANLTASRLLGLQWNKLVHSRFVKFVEPDPQDTFYFHVSKVLGTRAEQNCEVLLRPRDGATFFAHLESAAVQKEGKPPQIRATLSDVTEHKKAEEFNSSLLENAPNPLTRDLVIRYVNPAVEKITGFTSAELVGKKPPYPYWHQKDHERYKRDLNADAYDGDRGIERQFCTRSGGSFWVEINTTAAKEESRTSYYIVDWLDITRRKDQEQALKKSEEKYRSLYETMLDGFVRVGMGGRILESNGAYK
jgi:PAS domain S-box-containing protein